MNFNTNNEQIIEAKQQGDGKGEMRWILTIKYRDQRMVSLKSFLPYTNLLVFALRRTAPIMRTQPIHPPIVAMRIIPVMQSQKARDLHLLAVQILTNPTNCMAKPRQLRMGTTRVSGSEKDERIEVTVEMQIEVQAPPEQMLSGIDRAEKMLIRTSFTTGLAILCLWSMKEQNTKVAIDSASSTKDFLCLTSHLWSSKPVPSTPPSFFTTFPRQMRKQSKRVQEMTYLARLMPLCSLTRWQAQAPKTRMEGDSAHRKLKTSSSLMQAQTRRIVVRCMATVHGESSSSIAIVLITIRNYIITSFQTPKEQFPFQVQTSTLPSFSSLLVFPFLLLS